MSQIDRGEGRRLFGADPAAYDRARPGHPERVYEVLVERCELGPGARVLEIGPGTGQATRRLLELGAAHVLAVEPDPALAAYLGRAVDERVEIAFAAIEDVELPKASFDLAAAASSFHWVDEASGLDRAFAALRPGGWVALWWTEFGVPDERDAFIEATTPLLQGLARSPSKDARGGLSHARDAEARLAAMRAAGFVAAETVVVRWRTSWNTAGIRALYGTFSPIARLEAARRGEILDGVSRIADEGFGGRVERTLLTTLYTARKPA